MENTYVDTVRNEVKSTGFDSVDLLCKSKQEKLDQ